MDRRDISNTHDRFWAGFFLLVAGCLLLAYKMGAPLPGWLFTLPTLLIALGLFIGIKNRFSHPLWLVLTGVGVFLSLDTWFPGLDAKQYTAPGIIIMIGLIFMFRPRRGWRKERAAWRQQWKEQWRDAYANTLKEEEKKTPAGEMADGEFIDSVIAFGGLKKKIVSKKFLGGDITCFMGGAEIDLTHADVQGHVVLEVTQVFGGTKLIIPPHWHVKSEVVALFAGVEDKRPIQNTPVDPDKVIILRGTSVFAGIELNSF
jgi:predicted membrane protein